MKLQILALDGVFDTGLSTLLDVLGTANELNVLGGFGLPPFEVATIGVRSRVRPWFLAHSRHSGRHSIFRAITSAGME